MKIITAIILLGYLNCAAGNCQLLSQPSVTVADIEAALTNSEQLRKILKEHNFENSTSGPSKINQPGTMSNPLYPDLRILRSENWVLKNPKGQTVFIINLFEWQPDHAPQPDVIKTIRIMVNQDSEYTDQMKAFLGKIKERYPDKSLRYFRDDEFFRQFGEPLNVFTNGSKIEVRTQLNDKRYGPFYVVSFDLIK